MYLAGFLLNISYAFLVYIESSYLETYISKSLIGILFSIAAVVGIFLLAFLPRLLRSWGQLRLTRVVLSATMLCVFGMAFAHSALQISIFFVLFYAIELALWVLLDLYLEHVSTVKTTGDVRGHYLTINALAFAISPLLVGKIVAALGYPPVYILSALMLIPVFFVLNAKIGAAPKKKFIAASPLAGLRHAWSNKNILAIASTYFLLELFYCIMVIYTPIYLNSVLKMPWDQIGIVFTVMLLPFVLFELPLGKIADKKLGEQELLIAGLCVMSAATITLSFITSASVLLWSLALFGTRTGASIVEVMNETYFFKHVRDSDADVISFYRNAKPVAYIVGPLLATGVLLFIPMQSLFALLGLLLLVGLYPAFSLEDTL